MMRMIESLDGELIPVPDMPAVPALADDEPLDDEDEAVLAWYFKRHVEATS